MRNCGIYKITSPSGRVYIGQSKDLNRRRKEYSKLQNCKLQIKLHNSLLKYGWIEHNFDVIEYCSVEDLNCSERFWQDEFDVLNGGLNSILQECGEARKVISKETRSKMGSKGEKNFFYGKTEFIKRGEEHYAFGKPSPYKGVKFPERQGENSPFYGIERTEEVKDSISKTRKEKGVAVDCKNPKARRVINTKTLEEHCTIKEAALVNKLGYSTLCDYLHNRKPNKTDLIFKDKYIDYDAQ